MKSEKIENIIIIGGVGTALNIVEQIIDAKKTYSMLFNLKGIIIDSFEKGHKICGVPVVGSREDIPTLLKNKSIKFIFALFKQDRMKERYDLMDSFKIPIARYANFIHPLSYVAESVTMGKGDIILSNSTIQSNVVLGNMNIINSNVSIEHDTKIGNGNFFAANSCISSKVSISNHCFFGLNSSVRENIVLGDKVFVGMHSLVLNDFSNVTVAGIPAKPVKNKNH